MAMFRWVVCTVLLGLFAGVHAAPPAGHPTVEQAGHALKLPPGEAELSHEGKVVQVIPSNEYIYLEVMNSGRNRWLAAPAMDLKIGDTIRFPNGTVMTNFYSKRLNRTFDEILFVGRIKAVGK